MSMGKKDFIALADTLRPILGPDNESELWTGKREHVVNFLCAFMRGANPRFKEDRWRAYLAGQCGPSGGAIKKAKKLERWPGGGPVLPGDR